MENNEILLEEKYTNEDVLKVLRKLPEFERDSLLTIFTVSDIRKLLNKSAKEYEQWNNEMNTLVEHYAMMLKTVELLYKGIDAMLLDDEKCFSSDYDKLTDEHRKRVALELLNNNDFQKNCCEILVKDYKRIVKSNDLLTVLDSVLGLGKYYEKCIQTGFGCDHKYEVE